VPALGAAGFQGSREELLEAAVACSASVGRGPGSPGAAGGGVAATAGTPSTAATSLPRAPQLPAHNRSVRHRPRPCDHRQRHDSRASSAASSACSGSGQPSPAACARSWWSATVAHGRPSAAPSWRRLSLTQAQSPDLSDPAYGRSESWHRHLSSDVSCDCSESGCACLPTSRRRSHPYDSRVIGFPGITDRVPPESVIGFARNPSHAGVLVLLGRWSLVLAL
jgi:hypothetical protein